MSYKSVREILNAVFNSNDNVLNTIFKDDGEFFNLVYDPDNNALKVNIIGFDGSGGTTTGGFIDGEVMTFADLPIASSHSGEIYIVSTTTGIPLINRRQAGMYRSDGTAWSLLDVDLQADKVYYTGSLASGNVKDALEELKTTTDAKLGTSENAVSATKLTTARTINGASFDGTADITTTKWGASRLITLSGDVGGAIATDGSANMTCATYLSNTGVSAGDYAKVTVNTKGRVTAGTNPSTIAGYGITDAYTKTETDALLASGTFAEVPVFKMSSSSTQTISDSVETKITFNTIDFDTHGVASTATGRVTPNLEGYYELSVRTFLNDSAITRSRALIFKNGSLYSANAATGAAASVGCNAIVYANGTTDYFEFYAFGDTSDGTTWDTSSLVGYRSEFSGKFLSR